MWSSDQEKSQDQSRLMVRDTTTTVMVSANEKKYTKLVISEHPDCGNNSKKMPESVSRISAANMVGPVKGSKFAGKYNTRGMNLCKTKAEDEPKRFYQGTGLGQ